MQSNLEFYRLITPRIPVACWLVVAERSHHCQVCVTYRGCDAIIAGCSPRLVGLSASGAAIACLLKTDRLASFTRVEPCSTSQVVVSQP